MPHDLIDNRSDKLLDAIRVETLKVCQTFRVYGKLHIVGEG